MDFAYLSDIVLQSASVSINKYTFECIFRCEYLKKLIERDKIDISSDLEIVCLERKSEKMKRVGVPSSSNGNAEGTIGDQNLVVTRNNANTDAFDELLTDLEVKLDLFCVEVEQIKNHFLKLKGMQFSFSHSILSVFIEF